MKTKFINSSLMAKYPTHCTKLHWESKLITNQPLPLIFSIIHIDQAVRLKFPFPWCCSEDEYRVTVKGLLVAK